MLKFTTRDILWAMIVVALLASHTSRRLAVMRAVVDNDLRWNQLARDAGVIRQIQCEQMRQTFNPLPPAPSKR